jgi:GNAT superfamily N-acetyltransferase
VTSSLPAIRRAGLGDLASLVELHRQFCVVDQHPFNEQRATAAFAGLLRDDRHGAVWIVDERAGYAVLTWGWSIEAGGAEAVLDEIFVTEQGHGIGADLIEHVIAQGREQGFVRIFLETEAHNARVRAFYERHGFAVDDSIWMSIEFTDLS